MKPKPRSTKHLPRFAPCTDCGRYELLAVYVTGAPLCPACGLAEVKIKKAS